MMWTSQLGYAARLSADVIMQTPSLDAILEPTPVRMTHTQNDPLIKFPTDIEFLGFCTAQATGREESTARAICNFKCG